MLIRFTVLFIFAGFLYTPWQTAPASPVEQKRLQASEIQRSIEERGASATLNRLALDSNLFDQLERHLRNGEPRWLGLFVSLRGQPKNDWGGQLDLFLAYALAHNTSGTLRTIQAYQNRYGEFLQREGFPSYAELVCGNVDQDWILGTDAGTPDMARRAVATLQRRTAALDKMKVDELKTVHRQCRRRIRTAVDFWRGFGP